MNGVGNSLNQPRIQENFQLAPSTSGRFEYVQHVDAQKGCCDSFKSFLAKIKKIVLDILLCRSFEVPRANDRSNDQTPFLQRVMTSVGGEEAFNRLPVFDLGDRVHPPLTRDFGAGPFVLPANFYISIRPEEMPQPIMRGVDVFGRPFVAFKLRDNHPSAGSNCELVEVIYQHYENDNREWISSYALSESVEQNSRPVRQSSLGDLFLRLHDPSRLDNTFLLSFTIEQRHLDILAQIVVGRHLRFSLVQST